MAGSYLTALGSVSRHGQWRYRRVFRARDARGRLDLTDAGLVDFAVADLVTLGLHRRAPFLHRGCGLLLGPTEPEPVLFASTADGSLFIANPGVLEALFPAGWSACIPPGLYDVRVTVTVGPETEVIADDPVRIV